MRRVVLTYGDIEPLKRALEECAALGSGLVLYKGEGWDWRMARYALEDLKARKKSDENADSSVRAGLGRKR